MKRRIAVLLLLALGAELPLWAGLGSDKTSYIGGTVNSIKEGTEGKSSAKDEKVFVFDYHGGKLVIPYDHSLGQ